MGHPAVDGILLEMKKCVKIHMFRAAHVKKWHPRRFYGAGVECGIPPACRG
jgi:hypothetical protein